MCLAQEANYGHNECPLDGWAALPSNDRREKVRPAVQSKLIDF